MLFVVKVIVCIVGRGGAAVISGVTRRDNLLFSSTGSRVVFVYTEHCCFYIVLLLFFRT